MTSSMILRDAQRFLTRHLPDDFAGLRVADAHDHAAGAHRRRETAASDSMLRRNESICLVTDSILGNSTGGAAGACRTGSGRAPPPRRARYCARSRAAPSTSISVVTSTILMTVTFGSASTGNRPGAASLATRDARPCCGYPTCPLRHHLITGATRGRSAGSHSPEPGSPYRPAAGSARGSGWRFPARSPHRGCGCGQRSGSQRSPAGSRRRAEAVLHRTEVGADAGHL